MTRRGHTARARAAARWSPFAGLTATAVQAIAVLVALAATAVRTASVALIGLTVRTAGVALIGLTVLTAIAAGSSMPAGAADPAPPPRVEARSANLLAVGVVHGEQMSIHLSRLIDNAPVRDAVVSVMLRGTAYRTIAESDGSYTLQSKDLWLPGAAAVEFQVAEGDARDTLKGTLTVGAAAAAPEDKNTARQLGWWVLNFAVCIGFLWLLSRRRKTAS